MQAGSLPPGPKLPTALVGLGWWKRPTAYAQKLEQRFGTPFTVPLLGAGKFVVFSDPEHIKAIFTAPPDVLHPGEGARIIEPLVGRHSVILLDEDEHLSQRKLILPAFHGERIEALRGLVAEICEQQIRGWPTGERISLHPRLQELTLEVIMQAVFGIRSADRRARLGPLLAAMLAFGESPASVIPPARRSFFGRGPWARFIKTRAAVDEIVFAELDERRDSGAAAGGSDILSTLLEASHEDGSPMGRQEIRDELMTLLVAGHETTATQLSWTIERLTDQPLVLERVRAAVDSGEEAYVIATVREAMRRRPTLPFAAPRRVVKPFSLAGYDFEPPVNLFAGSYLVHHNPEIYPDPYAFRPERFLESEPGTYTWIPFGGGRRRCIGASFAMLEMQIVLEQLVGRFDLRAGPGGPEATIRRAITIAPGRGAEVALEWREPVPA